MSDNLIMRIWKDPVWSKVIAVAIVAALGTLPISIYWTQIVGTLSEIVIPFLMYNWQIVTICVLGFAVVVLLLALITSKKKNDSKQDPIEKWFASLDLVDLSKHQFLFWFPLNGVLRSPSLHLRFDAIIQLKSSKIIGDLLERGALSFVGMSAISIDKGLYAFLETQLKEVAKTASEESKQNMLAVKNAKFVDLVWDCVFGDPSIL